MSSFKSFQFCLTSLSLYIFVTAVEILKTLLIKMVKDSLKEEYKNINILLITICAVDLLGKIFKVSLRKIFGPLTLKIKQYSIN